MREEELEGIEPKELVLILKYGTVKTHPVIGFFNGVGDRVPRKHTKRGSYVPMRGEKERCFFLSDALRLAPPRKMGGALIPIVIPETENKPYFLRRIHSIVRGKKEILGTLREEEGDYAKVYDPLVRKILS